MPKKTMFAVKMHDLIFFKNVYTKNLDSVDNSSKKSVLKNKVDITGNVSCRLVYPSYPSPSL